MRRAVHTKDQLCVSRVGLSLQRSNENVDQSQPQWEERYRLVVGPSILLIKFALQQNLKPNKDMLEITFLSFILQTDQLQNTKGFTSDLMLPKWCGNGSIASKMLMEALRRSVGLTYIMNLESSLIGRNKEVRFYLVGRSTNPPGQTVIAAADTNLSGTIVSKAAIK